MRSPLAESGEITTLFSPGAEFVGLERLLIAFSMAREADIDDWWRDVECMSGYRPKEGVRTWWRRRGRTGVVTWISDSPGEFRTDPPEPPCEILDFPDVAPTVRCRDILRQAIKACQFVAMPSKREEILLASAAEILDKGRALDRDRLNERLRNNRGFKGRHEFNGFLEEIYRDFFRCYRTTVDDFTPIVLLLHLQQNLGWIDQDWVSDPSGYLYDYLKVMANSDASDELVKFALDLGNTSYEAGRQFTSLAIKSPSMVMMARRLFHAYHLLLKSKMISEFLIQVGVANPSFEFTSIVLDEALVCILSGVHAGAQLFGEHPQTQARIFLRDAGPSLPALRRVAFRRAREIDPSFTGFFAEILAAQALTLAEDDNAVQEGVEELARLRNMVSILIFDDSDAKDLLLSSSFEAWWIESAVHAALQPTPEGPSKPLNRRLAARYVWRYGTTREEIAAAHPGLIALFDSFSAMSAGDR